VVLSAGEMLHGLRDPTLQQPQDVPLGTSTRTEERHSYTPEALHGTQARNPDSRSFRCPPLHQAPQRPALSCFVFPTHRSQGRLSDQELSFAGFRCASQRCHLSGQGLGWLKRCRRQHMEAALLGESHWLVGRHASVSSGHD